MPSLKNANCIDCNVLIWSGGTGRCRSCALKYRNAVYGNPNLGRKFTDEQRERVSVASLAHAKYGAEHHTWKGGRVTDNKGYIKIRVPRGYPGRQCNGYMMEHRYVMQEHLGRPLLKEEQVHHKNGDVADNRLENLELVSAQSHRILSAVCSHCDLREEVNRLRKEVERLTSAMGVTHEH